MHARSVFGGLGVDRRTRSCFTAPRLYREPATVVSTVVGEVDADSSPVCPSIHVRGGRRRASDSSTEVGPAGRCPRISAPPSCPTSPAATYQDVTRRRSTPSTGASGLSAASTAAAAAAPVGRSVGKTSSMTTGCCCWCRRRRDEGAGALWRPVRQIKTLC